MKLKKRILYHYNRIIKFTILNVFYKNNHTQEHFRLSSSQLIAIFLFQKVIGINRHISFPVHFTNFIGRSGFLKVDKSSIFSFAANGGMYIQTINGIILTKNILIAAGVKIISADHNKENISTHIENGPITIGDNCWLGSNVVILPGTHLGSNVIVGAGSVVTKSFHSGTTIVGIPARKIGTRKGPVPS